MFESAKKLENGGVWLNSGTMPPLQGGRPPQRSDVCSPEKMSLHLLPIFFQKCFVREKREQIFRERGEQEEVRKSGQNLFIYYYEPISNLPRPISLFSGFLLSLQICFIHTPPVCSCTPVSFKHVFLQICFFLAFLIDFKTYQHIILVYVSCIF